MTEKNINGILAYGSLISDPRDEIEQAMIDCSGYIIGAFTPFRVEFARKSSKRADAPTLVPFKDGKRVKAQVFVMNLAEDFGVRILFNREMGKPSIYKGGPIKFYDANGDMNEIYEVKGDEKIVGLKNFAGLDKVLVARFAHNIKQLDAEKLSCLAIQSAANQKNGPGRDGISYLIDAKKDGIITLLSADYEKEILRKTNSCCLEQALEWVRSNWTAPKTPCV